MVKTTGFYVKIKYRKYSIAINLLLGKTCFLKNETCIEKYTIVKMYGLTQYKRKNIAGCRLIILYRYIKGIFRIQQEDSYGS